MTGSRVCTRQFTQFKLTKFDELRDAETAVVSSKAVTTQGRCKILFIEACLAYMLRYAKISKLKELLEFMQVRDKMSPRDFALLFDLLLFMVLFFNFKLIVITFVILF